MVSAFVPAAIFIGGIAAVGLLVMSSWGRVVKALAPLTETYSVGLQRAGFNVRAQDLVMGVVGGAVVAWVSYMLIARPSPLVALLALPLLLLLGFGVCRAVVQRIIAKRLAVFTNQLELVLRLISSGLRVGMSIRQAMMLVIEQSPDPARHEFMRLIGQTNIGMSVYDALDILAKRMPSNEMTMMARAIRLQSQTGGNLAKVLEQLATTIKDRRRIQRKIRAITSEGRASGGIIGALPVVVGALIMALNPSMRDGMFETAIGHYAMLTAFIFEGTGIFILSRIVRVDI